MAHTKRQQRSDLCEQGFLGERDEGPKIRKFKDIISQPRALVDEDVVQGKGIPVGYYQDVSEEYGGRRKITTSPAPPIGRHWQQHLRQYTKEESTEQADY